MASIIKGFLAIIASLALGFILPAAIAMSYEATPDGFPLGTEGLIAIWLITSAIISIPIRRVVNKRGKIGSGKWEPPEQIRDRVVSTPQFVGRLDRKNGLLETTARMVEFKEVVNRPSYWSQRGKDYQVIRFRGEILDQNGSPLESIPVEVTAKLTEWVGSIAEGDRVRVEGKFQEDGILHTDRIFNYSTNSLVGNKK